MKKSRQLSMAAAVVGMQIPIPTCELILELMGVIRDKGDSVSLGDINRIVDELTDKQRKAQMIAQATPKIVS